MELRIRCKNSGENLFCEVGTTLAELYSREQVIGSMALPPMCAKVNNKVVELSKPLYHCCDVEYLDLTSPSGLRVYTRTLFFVLCKAVHELFPQSEVRISIPVSNGYYCDLRIGRAVTEADRDAIKARMQQIIDADMPVERHEATTEEAISIFTEMGDMSKVKLLESLGKLYTIYYNIGDYHDYYYGALLPRTGMLTVYDVESYYDGLLLRIPSCQKPTELSPMTQQDKMFGIFREHQQWQDIFGISTIGELNRATDQNRTTELITLSETLQAKKISKVAEQISLSLTLPKGEGTLKIAPRNAETNENLPPLGGGSGRGCRVVLIAGPSSSGKTTTCKRLMFELLACGVKPIAISLDDYFLDRAKTPLDEKGEYDFESLYALNLERLNSDLQRLFKGEKVQLPRYHFKEGVNRDDGEVLQLHDDEVLIMEGIHALNPELTASIPDEYKFKVYASALTTILIDYHNYIPTTDNRLLRRIIRDVKQRGCSAADTIRRWPSVRAGENKWIFPYQENADAMINTAQIFELGVIKAQAEPLLEAVPENSPEYSEAYRLRKFLSYIKPIDQAVIPTTSLLREFLGGSSFVY